MAHSEIKTDRGRSWIVAACCCFCNLTFYGVARLSGMMLVATTHTFHVSRARAAVPFSLSTAIRNLAGLFVGQIGHRFGVGPVVAVGCIIASLGSGLSFLAKDMQWLTLCWGGMFGIGFGLCTCLLPLAINQYFTKHNGAAIGIAYSGSYIGSFIFPPIVVWLLANYELQGTFLIISGAILNVLVAAMFLKKPKSVKNSLQKTVCSNNFEHVLDEKKSVCANSISAFDSYKVLINDGTANFEGFCQKDYFDERRNKSNLKNTNVSRNNIYSIQDSFICLNNDEIHQNNPSLNYVLHPNEEDRQNYPSKICRNIQIKQTVQSDQQLSNYSSNAELPKELVLSSSYSIINGNLQDLHQNSQCMEMCFVENHKLTMVKSSAKENHEVPISSCRRIGLEVKPLSKSKLKAKLCKLRLHKIKKVLEKLKKVTLQNRSHCLKTVLAPNDSIQLLSLKYFQPFWCSCSPLPIKRKSLSSPKISTKISRQRERITHGFRRKFNNYSFSLKENSKSDENVFPRGNLKITEQTIYLPISQNLYKNTEDSSFPEVQEKFSQDITSVQNNIPSKFRHIPSFQTCTTHRDYEHLNLPYSNKDNDSTFSNQYISNIGKLGDADCVSCDTFFNSSHSYLEHNHTPYKKVKSPKSLQRFPITRISKKCLPDWCRMFYEPMFIVISFSMAIQTFIVVCVVTTIEDFAKDVGIPENKVHYAIMALSTANLVGTLTLGAITDRGFISRHRFLSLCFLGMSISLTAVSLVPLSLASLLSLMVIHGLLESGVVITFPLLVRQFMDGERRQAVAIASSNALSAPAVMLVPMLIGHFRDNIGCYTGLFHVLGATSFTCCLVWLVAPSLCQGKCSKKFKVIQVTERILN